MKNRDKLILGIVLGLAGYFAFKKLKRTQTVIGVDDLVISDEGKVMDLSTVAGWTY